MTLLYLDTSALFKRYVEEAGSEALLVRTEDAPAVGTALFTRVEGVAALAKAVRDDRTFRLRKHARPRTTSSTTGPTSRKSD